MRRDKIAKYQQQKAQRLKRAAEIRAEARTSSTPAAKAETQAVKVSRVASSMKGHT